MRLPLLSSTEQLPLGKGKLRHVYFYCVVHNGFGWRRREECLVHWLGALRCIPCEVVRLCWTKNGGIAHVCFLWVVHSNKCIFWGSLGKKILRLVAITYVAFIREPNLR